MDCLLLNANGLPVNLFPVSLIDWQEAIRLVVLDKARVIASYEDWTVRSPSISLKVPAVLMLTEHMKIKHSVCFSKTNIFLRDEYKCQYCGVRLHERDCTVDHVIPRSYGGKSAWENLTTSCKKCNSAKGNNHKIVPSHKPHKPDYWELANKRKKLPFNIKHESWRQFLSN